ncbi:MAG: hypothetical protein GXY32_07105 [Ruminococcaceae bacterium]|nr:hypothetical protein [Oscillospiraceae bacterium]
MYFFSGNINIIENAQGGAAVENNAVLTLDAGSTWTLTGNCSITSLENNGTINYGSYTITLADGTVLVAQLLRPALCIWNGCAKPGQICPGFLWYPCTPFLQIHSTNHCSPHTPQRHPFPAVFLDKNHLFC